jgi:hypothetical protein
MLNLFTLGKKFDKKYGTAEMNVIEIGCSALKYTVGLIPA